MKNHFLISYAGNKREEVEGILNFIESKNFNDIDTIIEPFCGTSAMSYYISLKYPLKFKYILNDYDKNLMNLYKIASNEVLFRQFNDEYNDKVMTLTTKDAYVAMKNEKTFLSWFITNKVYSMRPGIYDKNYKLKHLDLEQTPIIKFLRTEQIEFSNIDGCEVLKQHQADTKTLIFIDPPYMMVCNSFYSSQTTDIYEYLVKNTIKNMNSFIVLVIEKNWINELMFNDLIKETYNKMYQLRNKKKTQHIIVSNK